MRVLKFTILAAAILAAPMTGFSQNGAGYGPEAGYPMPGPYGQQPAMMQGPGWTPDPTAGGYPGSTMGGYSAAPGFAPDAMVTAYGEPAPPVYGPMPGGVPCADGAYGVAGGAYGGGSPFHSYWVRAEYLSWRAKGNDLPPLLTTSPVGTPQGVAGELGQPTTSVLFGDTGVDDEYRSGARIALGFWVTEGEFTGWEVEYSALTDAGTDFNIQSTFSDGPNDRILARPFFNVLTGQQDALLLAFPNFLPDVGPPADVNGIFSAETNSSTEGLAVTRRDLLWADQAIGYRSYFLAGYRYMNLYEDLTTEALIQPVGGAFIPGSFIDSFALFDTENDFHGLELGIETQYNWGQWSWEVLTKLALGNSHEVVTIDGKTVIFNGFTTEDFTGNTITQRTNIGEFKQNEFAMIPEFGINLAYQFSPNLKFTVGYSFVYYSHVVRPGDQIDLGLNPSQFDGGTLVGPARPRPLMEDTDFFLYGGNAGIEWRW